MRRAFFFAVLMLAAAAAHGQSSYLFVWAGPDKAAGDDFLGVIDADPNSPGYGRMVASLPVKARGTHPHHTELEMPANGHLLANGFHSGQTWLFDVTKPRKPRILTSFNDRAGLSHPHTFIRLPNGNVLATFQYRADAGAQVHSAMHHEAGAHAMPKAAAVKHTTGGLIEMDERGRVVRSGAAAAAESDKIYPYSVLPLPQSDRAISTTTDMDEANTAATAEWIQVWRLSDLKLLSTFALPPGPRGDEHRFTGEPKLLPDGKNIYIHTFHCGLYLLPGAEATEAQFVYGFEGKYCGVPVQTSHYWLQPVPEAHALVALDIADPQHPREVSRVNVGEDEQPHWLAIDSTGRRLVLNSGGEGAGNRLYVINFDPATGALALDARFRDAASDRPGVSMNDKKWPHGYEGKAIPHGTLFSR